MLCVPYIYLQSRLTCDTPGMFAPAAALHLDDSQQEHLRVLVGSRETRHKVTVRARIILLAAEGRANRAIAQKLQVSRPTVLLWRGRFLQAGVPGLLREVKRPGRKRKLSPDKTIAVMEATLHTTPAAATHWSIRTLAKAQGLSRMAVQRIWKAHRVPPHRLKGGHGADRLADLATITSRIASKRRWRSIERHVQRNEGRVRVSQLAHRFKLTPSTVSRGLKRRGISLQRPPFRWETGGKPDRKQQVQKWRQALALYFLSLTRNQIERCMPIKSATVRRYLLALTTAGGQSGSRPFRMFSDYVVESLAKELERAYGLGDYVREVMVKLGLRGLDYFSEDASAFLREFRLSPPSLAFLVRKLRQILKARVCCHGRAIQVVGRNERLVKVRIPRQ
jgi:transposase/AraC-like DNA-binding protein